ncbi:nucleotide-binding universal stress UspA family protein [Nakamurella sp. UYEF19]|uniref:universal stress protein n=1 Tax=Nakamurella sp. UYEF19 TaxID=1756392 RepID=UPI00339A7CF2
MNTIAKNVVLVGVDGSSSSGAAAMWAAQEAERRGSALHLLQCYDVAVTFAGPGVVIPTSVYEDVEHWARWAVSAVRDAIAALHPDLAITTDVREGAPVRLLREASEGVLLTVVGSHGDSEIAESILGSVALRVAAGAAGPVVVIRTDPTAGPAQGSGPVWVGLDGSGDSEGALAFAFEEASMRGTRLVAVHSWNNQPADGFVRPYPVEVDRERFEQERRLLAEQLAGWSEKYPDVEVHPVVLRGRPAASMLEHWKETTADNKPSLLVVGSRGHGGFVGLLMGSTSQALIAHAPCPVAVVRPHIS